MCLAVLFRWAGFGIRNQELFCAISQHLGAFVGRRSIVEFGSVWGKRMYNWANMSFLILYHNFDSNGREGMDIVNNKKPSGRHSKQFKGGCDDIQLDFHVACRICILKCSRIRAHDEFTKNFQVRTGMQKHFCGAFKEIQWSCHWRNWMDYLQRNSMRASKDQYQWYALHKQMATTLIHILKNF